MSKLLKLSSLSFVLALVAAGCTQSGPRVNSVQVNLVPKSIFEGEWWVTETVADLDGDGTEYGIRASYQLFPGGSNWGDYSYDEEGMSPVIGKITFVIDEDYLYAYRSYEIISGGNDDGDDPGFRGQPLAAFTIENHVDVQRGYNPVTGEENNTIVENTSDRRWYEREYMRVDWSTNKVQSFTSLTDIIDTFGAWSRESVPFQFGTDESHPDFSRSYAPQFVTVGEDPDYRWADDWAGEDEDTVHYMSFTTMTLFSPGASCLYRNGGPCQTFAAPMRLAFLRVPPGHEYASAQQPHVEFDQFGLFRTMQRTYVRGGLPQGETAEYCESDDDCGSSGYCELDANDAYYHRCAGGLTEDYGETDLLAFYRPRHNFYSDSLTDQECDADWECDGRYSGTPTGSMCDRAAGRCTIPVHERGADTYRQVTYHLSDGFPAHLVDAAYEVIGNWNEVFMRGMRVTHGQVTPDYSVASVPAQSDDPTAYCFSEGTFQAPEVREDGTCVGKFDPFVSTQEWADLGVVDPFDCQIVNTDGFTRPARPTSYDEYPLPAAYRWEFEGSECLFVLKSNACDLHRSDASVSCDDVTNEAGELVAWEQQGDIRYQFFNYVDQIGTGFGGVSEIRVDPTNGEIITADVNYGSIVAENLTYVANEWFPVLRCVNENGCAPGEEGADERYLEGENVREYFEALGRIERPVAIAPNVGAGTGTEDNERPAGRTLNGLPESFMASLEERAQLLGLEEGIEERTLIYQDRMGLLEGTEIENRFLETLDMEAMSATFANGDVNQIVNVDASAHASDVADQTSPFRNSGLASIGVRMDEMRLRQQREAIGIEFEDMTDVRSFLRRRYWEYWSEAFRGRTGGEASIRIQQQNIRGVMHHEVGHSVGLRHNFGGSVDRDNFGDGYFQVTLDQGHALPTRDFYDMTDFGGNADGFLGPEELENYRRDLDEARSARAAAGAHNHMTASIMDYNGDNSDVFGLGRYDKAAIEYSYFDLAEAYVGDPEMEVDEVTYTTSEGTERVVSNLNGLKRSDEASRVMWTRYSGGETCTQDTHCPYSAGSGTLIDGQLVTQRCVLNPRATNGQVACSQGSDPEYEGVGCVCSAFTSDFDDYLDGLTVNNDTDGDGEFDYTPVDYAFCSDERTNDISWCSRFDVGESFQEMIAHFRRNWYERYAGSYNRRFNAAGPTRAGSLGSIVDAVKIFQHFYFRWIYEPGFTTNTGPLGFYDQIDGSLDTMNWLMEMVTLPTEGSYRFNAETNSYDLVSEDVGVSGSDFSLSNGLGFPMWTSFQEGHQGFFRAERSGVFYDKFYALFGLALRDWGLSFTVDERFYVNYYDIFPVEMTEFFGGIITDQPGWFAPRVDTSGDEPVIIHPQITKGLVFGSCQDALGRRQPCNGTLDEVFAGQPIVNDSTNVVLRTWATSLALAQFPVYYDVVFEQRLLIYRLGDQNGFSIPDVQADTGEPTCGYGAFTVDASHNLYDAAGVDSCNSLEDANYAVYHSDRLNTTYVAVKTRARLEYNPEEEQLGFQFLARLIEQQQHVADLETAGASDEEIRAARIALEDNESFLQMLLQIMQVYGISNQFGF